MLDVGIVIPEVYTCATQDRDTLLTGTFVERKPAADMVGATVAHGSRAVPHVACTGTRDETARCVWLCRSDTARHQGSQTTNAADRARTVAAILLCLVGARGAWACDRWVERRYCAAAHALRHHDENQITTFR